MEEQKKRMVVVLFTGYRDLFSSFLYHIRNRGYTHAAVSLEEGSDYYYSFNRKGFRREYPKRYGGRLREQSAAFHLEVSEESYQRMRKRLAEMEAASGRYRYTRLGVFFCLLHIAWKRKRCYFCSQFVSELLELADGIQLRKQPSLYLPDQLAEELSGQACVKRIEFQVV
ncbi:MAG: hypothetical protein Q4F41_06030 [Eubacteriales bacterium]|nr:hypothetical protein [Eubacteriales bacterium]